LLLLQEEWWVSLLLQELMVQQVVGVPAAGALHLLSAKAGLKPCLGMTNSATMLCPPCSGRAEVLN